MTQDTGAERMRKQSKGKGKLTSLVEMDDKAERGMKNAPGMMECGGLTMTAPRTRIPDMGAGHMMTSPEMMILGSGTLMVIDLRDKSKEILTIVQRMMKPERGKVIPVVEM